MLDLATVSRVPAEFTGQARVFRDQVRAVDLAMYAALAMITEPLRARLGRHPKLRNEMVAGTARGCIRCWSRHSSGSARWRRHGIALNSRS
jgi:hypothetical protein